MKIKNLPRIEFLNLNRIKEKRKSIIFTDKKVWEIVNKEISFNQKDIVYVERPTKDYLYNLINSLKDYEVVYGIGGGVTSDIAKFIGFNKKIDTIVIPTILSTDAFLTSEVAVRINGEIKYFPAKHPDVLYIDLDIISKAPKRLNICGCGDILSIYTSLFDWKYANLIGKATEDEKISQYIYNISEAILKSVEIEKDSIRECNKKGLRVILDLLCMETQLCYIYGNSRPEEGSEHYFAYLMENIMKRHFLHGEMVALGILLMSYFQGQNYEYIKNLMDYIGLNYLGTGATKEEIMKAIIELPSYVKERNLRYSYAHDLLATNDKINFILEKIGVV
ncbi:MAG: iron-containing alcohol dehydrogenase [Nitrososphaerota archaeon]